MNRATFRLVLLISCAHALVHVFELSLPSVEQMIGAEFGVDRKQSGMLGTTWRLPFGFGALLAGWLADRLGAKRMLLVFLGGCVATSLLAFASTSMSVLFVVMFAMGCFASIYHPVGLALISRETTPANRPAALGWHGILGSIGITSTPLAAALIFGTTGMGWRWYYVVLCVPATIVAALIAVMLRSEPKDENPTAEPGGGEDTAPVTAFPEPDQARWTMFGLLVSVGGISGLVYAAFLHFLPRYLDTAGIRPSGMSDESFRNLLASIVLCCGIAGQALAGRMARPGSLERLLAFILFATVPCLLWVAVASGPWRLVAACATGLVTFMNQPVYNSLVAQYVPVSRRSVGYGFSNMVTFGFGALGPTCAGFMRTDLQTYGFIAALIALAAVISLILNAGIPSDDPGGTATG